MLMFKNYFESPLCLSNNLEDDTNTEVYYNCVKICNLLIDRLEGPQCLSFLSVLNFQSLIMTVTSIQEKVLSHKSDLLGKGIVCTDCHKQQTDADPKQECSFFSCAFDKVSHHDLRLSRIGYRLFIFLVKAKLMFPDKLEFELVTDQVKVEIMKKADSR